MHQFSTQDWHSVRPKVSGNGKKDGQAKTGQGLGAFFIPPTNMN